MADIFSELPFVTSSLQEWQQAASHELDGADPFKKLTISESELSVKPYYDSSNSTPTPGFELATATNSFQGPRQWMNLPKILVHDASQANQQALEYLNSGADGILFECLTPTLDFNRLLAEIKPEFCNLSFLSNTVEFDTAGLLAWVERTQAYSIQGAIYQAHPNASKTSFAHFYPVGILVKPNTNPIEEIATALVTAVQVLAQSSANVIHQIAFSLPVQTHLFQEVAKLKALRMLWYQIQGAYGMELKPVHLHAYSEVWIEPAYQPHGNMIKATTACLAAILGGCDSVTMLAENPDNSMMNRIARNVSTILREESYLNKVADPVAGSYYVDTLVTELAEKAWHKFQQRV